jgi:hypothetical protein
MNKEGRRCEWVQLRRRKEGGGEGDESSYHVASGVYNTPSTGEESFVVGLMCVRV